MNWRRALSDTVHLVWQVMVVMLVALGVSSLIYSALVILGLAG